MKRKKDLYKNIYELNNIIKVFNEVCKNTKNKKKVEEYKKFKCANVYHIQKILKNKEYNVGKYYIFTIYEPKERTIVSQDMEDKIINHLVARYILYPAIIPCLIDANVASRKNMGVSKGLKLANTYRSKCNIKYSNWYVLKCDISKFFYSINHEILKEKLKRRIKDNDAINIVNKIIDSYENGLGIGNMTSQILAIFYLNDLDHFIKEKLKIKYYVRYQDDFCLFHNSKEYLRYCLEEIKKFLKKEDLKLNEKTRIYKNTNNYMFLGRNIKNMYGKYRRINGIIKSKIREYEKGKIELYSLISSINTYKNLKNII